MNVTRIENDSAVSEEEKWMELALEQARVAFALGEVPVGAVLVKDNEPIAAAHNECMALGLATKHAEIVVLEAVEKELGRRFLPDCTLYVTMEPCPMCAGACVNAHLGKIVFGTPDPVSGACGSVINVSSYPLLYRPSVKGGVLSTEAKTLLQDFFKSKRKEER